MIRITSEKGLSQHKRHLINAFFFVVEEETNNLADGIKPQLTRLPIPTLLNNTRIFHTTKIFPHDICSNAKDEM